MADKSTTDELPSEKGVVRKMRIVGVGASAGGLESLERFFGRLASDTGDAFVVVQHLSPDFKSLMDELLARHSAMPITVAQDGVEVEPDHVYLMPPRKEISIVDGRLRLRDQDPHATLTRPIDRFLSSLAADQGPRSAAIVLSGSGSDGARGVVDIREAGGWVLVESPQSAQFDGMPRSALATSAVHEVGRPEQLAELLMESTGDSLAHAELASPLQRIFRRLNAAYGIDFSTYKEATIQRRIERRLQMLEESELEEYAARIDDDPEERSELYGDLLIGVTEFFRDPDAFEVVEKQVLVDILDRVPPEDEIRVWVAGCATGEEAYSLAMLLIEQLEARGRPLNLKVLATDVHRRSLEIAGRGVYSQARLDHIAPSRLNRFFDRCSGGYQVKPALRKLLVFAPHNVVRDAPFTRIHLVSCRNLLIYLNSAAQKSVLSLFHFGLVTGGVLFLGSSESPGALGGEFSAIDERHRVFCKRRSVRLLDHVRLPALPEHSLAARGLTLPPAGDTQLLGLYDRLLDRHMPPSYLLDADGTLVDSFGGAEAFLQVKKRRPSQLLVDMLCGDMRMFVSAGLAHVRKDHGVARYEGVDLPDGSGRQVALTVESLRNPTTETQHVLVTLEDLPAHRAGAPAVHPPAEPAPLGPADVSRERVAALEEELSLSKEKLQATIEELETSNEELQAANEELVASNEELQSTNEELHSVNEELYTVNAENERKIEELRQLSADVQNLLDGASIGTLVLDGRLRIRKFTSHIARLFHIIGSDVGRPIADFSHDLQHESLVDELRQVLVGGDPVETEVRDREGTPFFMRILPYLAPRDESEERASSPRAIGGVVMTLTDISPIEEVREQLAELSSIVASSDDAIIGIDVGRRITSFNQGASRLYGYDERYVLGRDFLFLVPEADRDAAQELVDNALAGAVSEPIRTRRRCKDGTIVDVSATISVKRRGRASHRRRAPRALPGHALPRASKPHCSRTACGVPGRARRRPPSGEERCRWRHRAPNPSHGATARGPARCLQNHAGSVHAAARTDGPPRRDRQRARVHGAVSAIERGDHRRPRVRDGGPDLR
jgi:two-component system CheB/CheR fusion protein